MKDGDQSNVNSLKRKEEGDGELHSTNNDGSNNRDTKKVKTIVDQDVEEGELEETTPPSTTSNSPPLNIPHSSSRNQENVSMNIDRDDYVESNKERHRERDSHREYNRERDYRDGRENRDRDRDYRDRDRDRDRDHHRESRDRDHHHRDHHHRDHRDRERGRDRDHHHSDRNRDKENRDRERRNIIDRPSSTKSSEPTKPTNNEVSSPSTSTTITTPINRETKPVETNIPQSLKILPNEVLIVEKEEQITNEEKMLEESRLRRQKIMEKYKQEQEQQQQQQEQPKEQKIEETKTNPTISPNTTNENKIDIKEDDESGQVFEWRKEDDKKEQQNGEEEELSCSSEEDLKKRGKIDASDITKKHQHPLESTTTTTTTTTKKAPVVFDMFSDSPSDEVDNIVSNVVQTNTNDNLNLTDNWDDPDGYYKYKIGEIMDNRFQIQAPLGSGVFSTVVTAKNIITNEEVVVKIIRNRPSMHRTGLKEIEILQKINNQPTSSTTTPQRNHCIQYKDSFTFRNHLCIVFEAMSMSLHQLIKKYGKNVGLSLNAVRIYAKQLFMALRHIRNIKILHSDIKPDNIVVNDAKNIIKLCDFGSAGEPHESEITPYLVSRFYRAPEIILGMKYDYAIDVWSVGCCLGELYTGKFLFPGKSNNDMIRLFLDYKGPFPKKMLKKGEFIANHFNDNLIFMKEDKDPIDQKLMKTPYEVGKPTKDILNYLKPPNVELPEQELKKLLQLKDLIERCTTLDPEKRITPSEALNHDFLKPY